MKNKKNEKITRQFTITKQLLQTIDDSGHVGCGILMHVHTHARAHTHTHMHPPTRMCARTRTHMWSKH